MVQPLKILFLSAEVAPFAKAGGLADVCGALPKALAALGHEVRVVMPAYRAIEAAAQNGARTSAPHPVTLQVPMDKAGCFPPASWRRRFPAAACSSTSSPSGTVSATGRYFYGYSDDPYRFAFFSRAALDLAVAALGWRPDVVHAHDWHTAPAIAWLATAGQADARYAGLPTVYTIHNLMHQGNAAWHVFDYLGLSTHSDCRKSTPARSTSWRAASTTPP